MQLKDFRKQFDQKLSLRYDERFEHIKPLFPDNNSFELITYLKEYSMHGKRFRPYMVYVRYTMFGGKDIDYIIKVGFVHELVHIFALIHDDICDEGTMRHGMKTYHMHLAQKYDDHHAGISQAMILGDLVLAWALQLACELPDHAKKILNSMLEEVMIGQMLDIDFSNSNVLHSAQDIATKDHLKSGQYTFQKPMMLGASLAGATEDDLDKISSIGKHIGIAFQERDDLLDRIPNNEGKTKMSDLQEGNQTSVLLKFKELISEDERKHLAQIRGTQLHKEEYTRLMDLFEKYNIKEQMISHIHATLDEVTHELDKGFGGLDVDNFTSIISFLREV